MKYNVKWLFVFLWYTSTLFSQNYPLFGPEKKVNINGLTFDAMEPFISRDGQTLFFNSLNSGGNTNLYYATRVNDTLFNYIGLVNGCYDPTPNHLDGVASLDSSNTFYWVSLRNYPIQIENLHKGVYSSGNVSSIKRVYGDFNIATPGWLIMDAAISDQGNLLYYCNAYFNSCAFGMPCKARLGVAQQVNDTTFNKLNLTDTVFSNVNDTNYIVYAPQVTEDGLELYFTRILKSTVNSEICVSVRNSTTTKFSLPVVIHSNLGFVPEAASPSVDKQKLYYHQKEASGLFRIYLRYRSSLTSIQEKYALQNFGVYPNPCGDLIEVLLPFPNTAFFITLYSYDGQLLIRSESQTSLNVSNLKKGLYLLKLEQKGKSYTLRLIKN